MKIVIEIPESVYNDCKAYYETHDYMATMISMIANGKPLPKGHGRLIDEKEAISIITYGKDDKAYFGSTDKDFEVIDFLKTVPTLIEADKGEENGHI